MHSRLVDNDEYKVTFAEDDYEGKYRDYFSKKFKEVNIFLLCLYFTALVYRKLLFRDWAFPIE